MARIILKDPSTPSLKKSGHRSIKRRKYILYSSIILNILLLIGILVK